MLSSVKSFLSQSSCWLLFPGAPKSFSLVQVGILQGASLSLLLLVIYVASLHLDLPRGLTIFYVYDFAPSMASLAYRTNIRVLRRAFGSIRA